MKWFRRLRLKLFPTYRRISHRCVSYREADILIKESAGKPEAEQWVIAPEEDFNERIGLVHLEQRERIWE